jgi:hypothetical protein
LQNLRLIFRSNGLLPLSLVLLLLQCTYLFPLYFSSGVHKWIL